MNKFFLSLISIIFCYGMNAPKVQAQTSAVVQAYASIINQNDIKVKYNKSFSQIVADSNFISGKSFAIPYVNGELISNTIQNLASFSFNSENKNSFSVSLPSEAVILTNSKNTNTLQMVGWKSSIQPGKGEFQNNSKVVNFGAFFKMGTVTDNPAGVYSGTYPVTFVYD